MTNHVIIGNKDDRGPSALSSLQQENAELKKELYRLSLVIEGTQAGY